MSTTTPTRAQELLEKAPALPWYWDSVMGGIRVADHYIVTSQGWTGHDPKPSEALILYAVNRLPLYEKAVEALRALMAEVEFHESGQPYYCFTRPGPAEWKNARSALAALDGEGSEGGTE